MAKTTGPLFSMGARGTVGKTLTYSIWKGISYVREWLKPQTTFEEMQVAVRAAVTLASRFWSEDDVTAPQKAAYNAAASGQPYSGFNLYIKRALEAMVAQHTPDDVPTVVAVAGNYPDDVFTWTEA